MKQFIGCFILRVTRWKSDIPSSTIKINKCVLIAAPHTSNWDLIYALAVFWKKRIPIKFFIKDYYTKSFFGFFFKWLGAIGVDRSKNNNLVDFASNLLKKRNKLYLIVPAEASRKKVDKWKTGFYHIAKNADVPVQLGYLDYKHKIAGVGYTINLTSSFESDMKIIENFYLKITPKYPEKYNKNIF